MRAAEESWHLDLRGLRRSEPLRSDCAKIRIIFVLLMGMRCLLAKLGVLEVLLGAV